MFCRECGHKLANAAVRCDHCGTASVPPKKQQSLLNIRPAKVVSIGVIAIVVIIGAVFFLKGDSQNSPEATMKQFIEAMDDGDFDEISALFYAEEKPDTGDLKQMKAMFEMQMDTSDFEVLDYVILHVEEDGDNATVEYAVTYSRDGEKDTEEDSMDLIKVDGKWYIDESFMSL